MWVLRRPRGRRPQSGRLGVARGCGREPDRHSRRTIARSGPSTTSAGHRGTRLLTEPRGLRRQANPVPLPRPGPMTLQGRLVAAPHMEEGPRFSKADYPLKSRPRSLPGMDISSSTSRTNPAPLADQAGDLPYKFQPWGMGELRRAHRIGLRRRRELEVGSSRTSPSAFIARSATRPFASTLALPDGRERAGDRDLPRGMMDLRDGIETSR